MWPLILLFIYDLIQVPLSCEYQGQDGVKPLLIANNIRNALKKYNWHEVIYTKAIWSSGQNVFSIKICLVYSLS